MDSLIGCGISCLTEAGNSCLAKIKKHVCYLFSYTYNMESLDEARLLLGVKIEDGKRVAADANNSFKVVSSTVPRWQKEADDLHQAARTIIKKYRRSSCLNPWSRYSSSEKAWELTQDITAKLTEAPDFGLTFDCPPPNSGPSFNLEGFMKFKKRLDVVDKVMEALKDEGVSMCSIIGMGGVGKTMLAKNLVFEVKSKNLFKNVAMVTVSQNPDLQAIQNQIIELLGPKIGEQTMPARANRLNYWLKNESSTLLVLDDVWRKLSDEDFEAVGIPSADKGCKFVFTSRNELECCKMGSRHNFRVDILEPGEAWDLFREKAGKCTEEDMDLQDTAKAIAAECGGLPLAIVTIATALEDKSQGMWNDSLLKLQSSNLSGNSDLEKVYFRIRLSYDLLDDREAKSIFLLCCLYPEDDDVPIEDLVLYGMGLELFDHVDSMSKARNRVESILHKLKKLFLLLDGDND